MHDRPKFPQPPLSVNVSRASCTLRRGARAQSGAMTAKSPIPCRMRKKTMVYGRREASEVLKRMEKTITPTARSVAW